MSFYYYYYDDDDATKGNHQKKPEQAKSITLETRGREITWAEANGMGRRGKAKKEKAKGQVAAEAEAVETADAVGYFTWSLLRIPPRIFVLVPFFFFFG